MGISTILIFGPFGDEINGTVIFLETGAPWVDVEVVLGS